MRDQSLLGRYTAYPLMIVGDDVTTDHISPASAIPAHSFVADYLASRGENRQDLNVFAARRGNWKVMLRGAFHSRALKNKLHRSEERRGGKEWVRKCRSRGATED